MSYKSRLNSTTSMFNRKISINLAQAQTEDASQQATSSKSHRNTWEKDASSIDTQSSSRVEGQEGRQVLSIVLYNTKYEVDCGDNASVHIFLKQLHETDAVKMETKLALSLMIAQRVQELRLNCEQMLN